ncbi:MAG TPA: hypothetical protein VM124_00750 [Candidatus Limnocylindrales bacterium]|nr:hypothetical protein [Candidatus Limnocylindrales bacterium]
MELLKSLLRGLASAGLKLGLVLLAFTSALVMVFSTSAGVKQALRSSQVYDAAIDGIISETAQSQDTPNEQAARITAQEPQIKQAAKTAFTPAVIQNSSEQIIDGLYGWLRSGSDKPDFRVDLTDAKQQFAEALADSAIDRAQHLPACTLQQARELAATTIDPFSVPCVPPGYNLGALRTKVVSDIANNQEFLKNPVITADSFPKDNQGRSVFQSASQAPATFQLLLKAPWIIAGLTALFGVMLLTLHRDKRRGLRSIALTLLGSGVFLLVASLLFNYAFKSVSQPKAPQNINVLQQPLWHAFLSLQNSVTNKLLWFGGIYTVLGVLGLLTLHFNNRVQELQAGVDAPSTPAPDTSELPPPTSFPPA